MSKFSNISRVQIYFKIRISCQEVQYISVDSNSDSIPTIIPHISVPYFFKNTLNAIRCLERDDYFPATTSVWPYIDRFDTGCRIKDVTSGEGPKAFRWRARFTIGYRNLDIVPRRILSARPVKGRSVIDHAPRLNNLCLQLPGKGKVGLAEREILTENALWCASH